MFLRTGLSPAMADLSSVVLLTINFVTPQDPCSGPRQALQPPCCNGSNL